MQAATLLRNKPRRPADCADCYCAELVLTGVCCVSVCGCVRVVVVVVVVVVCVCVFYAMCVCSVPCTYTRRWDSCHDACKFPNGDSVAGNIDKVEIMDGAVCVLSYIHSTAPHYFA